MAPEQRRQDRSRVRFGTGTPLPLNRTGKSRELIRTRRNPLSTHDACGCNFARRIRRGSRRRTRFTVSRCIRLASLSRNRSGVPPRPSTSSESFHRSPWVSIPSASHTLSNDNGQVIPFVKIQFQASLNELRLRRFAEPPYSCTTLIASASTASISRCSLESERAPTSSKNWLRRITSGNGRGSAATEIIDSIGCMSSLPPLPRAKSLNFYFFGGKQSPLCKNLACPNQDRDEKLMTT